MAINFLNTVAVDENVLFVDTTNDRVGIGTSTPGSVLDVQGSQGQLFSVTDDLSGDIFAVSDISGVPIMTVNSSGLSTFYGNVNLPDNKKILLGTGSDLEIYHDGTHSHIISNTGDLTIDSQGDDLLLKAADDLLLFVQGTEVALQAIGNAGVKIRYNNVVKFETQNGGAKVTGSLTTTATGGGTGILMHTNSGISINSNLMQFWTGQSSGYKFYANSTGNETNGLLHLDASGNAAFTGSISAGGTIGNLTAGSLGQQMEKGDASSTTLRFDANRWRLYAGASAGEVFTVEETGNVGINNTGPDYKLEVNGTFGVSDLPFNTDSVSVLVADEITGVEEVTNGSFTTDADWNKNSNWTISGGTANADGTSNADMNQIPVNGYPVVGEVFRVLFEITARTQGQVRIAIGGGTTDFLSAVGQYEYILTAANTDRIRIQSSGSFIGSVDNLSIKQVTFASNQIQKRELGTGAFGPTPVGAYLPLTAGSSEILTGDLAMNNNIGIITKDSSGAFRDILKLNSSNILEIGSSSLTTNTIFKNTGNVGINNTTPVNGKLVVDSDTETLLNTVRINHTRSNPNFATQALMLDMNLSGADNTTADRTNSGLHIDLDSSANGDAANEHRIRGVNSDVRFSGFSDNVQGVYGYVESNYTGGKTAQIIGVLGSAVHDSSSTDGGVSNMYGVLGSSNVQDLGDVDNAFGGYFVVELGNSRGNADFGISKGVEGHINIDKTAALNYGTMIAVSGIIDNNEGTVPNFSSQYLFKGDYQGTKGDNAYGIYTEGDKHYFDGNIGIGTTSPASKLSVGGNVITTKKPTAVISDETAGGSLVIRGLSPILSFDRTGANPQNKILMDTAGLEFKTGTLDAEGDVDFKITADGDLQLSKGAKISNQENTDIDTGAEVVAQVAINYTAAFFDFVVKKGTNVRSGTVYACHNGDTTPLVEFTETSTQDLGDTSDVVLSVDISGANMRLIATVASDDWSVKSLIRAI